MRKWFLVLSIIVVFSTLLVVPGCGKKEAAGGSELFSLLPDNAAGVLSVNFNKLAQLEFFDKMVREAEQKKAGQPGKIFESYQDFITKTGIDPKKDIQAVVIGLYGNIGPMSEPNAVILARVNYKKDTLLGIMNSQGEKVTKETYNTVDVFKVKDEHGKDQGFSFLGDNLVAGGTPGVLNQVIDLQKGTGKNILANAQMKKHLTNLKSGAILSMVFGLPEEVKKVHDNGMFKMDLSKAEAVVGYVDYENKTWTAEIKMISNNEEGNRQLVNTLSGFKMMAGAAGPEFAELANNLTLTSTADSVKLTLSITEELLEKVKTKMEEKSRAVMPPPTEEPQQPQETPETPESQEE